MFIRPESPCRITFSAIGLFALASIVIGCKQEGPELAPVSGRVLFDYKPLANVTLEFSPEGQGSTSYGVTDEDGNYELGYTRDKKGAMLGWHIIDIYFDDDIVLRPPVRIPARYNQKSELRKEVRDEENVIDFVLTSEN